MNIERWNALLRELGIPPETETLSRLQSAYAEGHRGYHTSRHIDECLSLVDELKHLCERPAEVECALWFHDAIYEPMSKSNEERSADWAAEFLACSGAAQDVVGRIRSHIMATRHEALPADADSSVVVDIDLSILGAEPSRYEEFERDVRKEYRWVPRFIYGPKRAAILQSFLDRPRIYQTEPMFERFEEKARGNVSKAIRALSHKSSETRQPACRGKAR
jgi:predicted metal-dependent HD superfamily phosphohydrolase